MGLFDHLFKSKTDSTPEEHVEAADTAPPSAAAVNVPPPKPPLIPSPTGFSPRSLGQVVTPGRAGAPLQRSAPAEDRIPAGGTEEKESRGIVLTLDDVLARIPTEFLAEGAHDGHRVLRFAIDDLAADIARGRAAVPLSQIAAQCPDIFRGPIDEDNDVLVRLPLQKLVEQIALGAAPTARPSDTGTGLPATPPDARIHLSIAAILRTCPPEIIVGEPPVVADTERIVFPFAPIERQLPSGRVDVSSTRFVAALPLHMHEHFRALEGVRVPLPLDEIFQNLPGQPAPMPASGSAAATTSSPPPVPASGLPPHPATPVPPAAAPAAEPATTHQPAPGSAEKPGTGEPRPAEAGIIPPRQPSPDPHVDLAKDEIAALRARIAALKVEFEVPSAGPAEGPPVEAAAVAAIPPAPVPESVPSQPVPAGAGVSAPGPRPNVRVSLGIARPPSGPPPVVIPSAEPAPPPAPVPELFRAPLVPPPASPIAVTPTPRVEPPAPVMLPVRVVAPPPARPHVAPPRLFSAGENAPLTGFHIPEPVLPPEPPVPPPPPPPPPLALERAGKVLGIGETLTLARVAEHLATLPGLGACVLDVRHEAADTGSFPEASDAATTRMLIGPLAATLAGREGEHITIFGEQGSISVFACGVARLAVLHRARVFLPGVRERLVATIEALAEA